MELVIQLSNLRKLKMVKKLKYCFTLVAGDYPVGFAYKEWGFYDTPEERDQRVKYYRKHKFIKSGSIKLFTKEIEMRG